MWELTLDRKSSKFTPSNFEFQISNFFSPSLQVLPILPSFQFSNHIHQKSASTLLSPSSTLQFKLFFFFFFASQKHFNFFCDWNAGSVKSFVWRGYIGEKGVVCSTTSFTTTLYLFLILQTKNTNKSLTLDLLFLL